MCEYCDEATPTAAKAAFVCWSLMVLVDAVKGWMVISERVLRRELGELFRGQRQRLGLTVAAIGEHTTVGLKGRGWINVLGESKAVGLLQYVDICWALELDPCALLSGIIARADGTRLRPGAGGRLIERSARVHDVVTEVGAALRVLRARLGWTADDLCVKLGGLITVSVLTSWETGEVGLSLLAFVRVVQALEESPGEVLRSSIVRAGRQGRTSLRRDPGI